LRDFRFDIVKIDGRFVTDIATNPDSRFFVEKLVEIGHHFDMMTVAEFVQNPAQARILREIGVDYFQGFYFGTPSLVLGPELKPETVVAGPAVLGAG
jgi:EAL domain-containing protein (putative c-di-GMP-specific phosphodiesterase class I)